MPTPKPQTDAEIAQMIEAAKPCSTCDNCDYNLNAGEFDSPWECGIHRVVSIDEMTSHKNYNYTDCRNCRERNCKGQWFEPRSADKPTIESLIQQKKEIEKRNAAITNIIVISFVVFCVAAITVLWFISKHCQ